MKFREIMKKGDNMKMDASGLDRAFGGINVLLVGDFWQLNPPKGGFKALFQLISFYVVATFRPSRTNHMAKTFYGVMVQVQYKVLRIDRMCPNRR